MSTRSWIGAIMVAAFAVLGFAAPPLVDSLEASSCGAHSGPQCATVKSETCVNLLFFKWCGSAETYVYYPGEIEEPEPKTGEDA